MKLEPLYKSQEPFMEFADGHGYLGVVLQDVETGKIQCHICGRLLKSVAKHLYHKHDMTTEQYREQTGLNRGTPLVCSETTKKIRESGWTEVSAEKREAKYNLLIANSKKTHRGTVHNKGKKGYKFALQYNNQFGTCPKQTLQFFWNQYKNNGNKIPPQNDKLRYLIYRDYSSYKEALMAWGVSEKEIKSYETERYQKASMAVDRSKAHAFTYWDSKEKVINAIVEFYKANKRSPTFSELRMGALPTRFAIAKYLGIKHSKDIKKFCLNNKE